MGAGSEFEAFAGHGFAPDLISSAAPADRWTRGRNVVFREYAERKRGEVAVYGAPLGPPIYALFTRDASEVPVWIYPSNTHIFYTDGSLHTGITPANFLTSTRENTWTGGILNSIPVLSSRRPYYWPGSGLMLDLPDWPVTRLCGAMRPYKFHLIAMAIDEGGTLLEDQVLWSDAAPPGSIPLSWTPSPDNEAGSTELSQTGGIVLDGLQLRESFIIYKDTSTYKMDYIGGAQVMRTVPLFTQSGLLNRNCASEFRNNHYVLTDGDLIVHDGQQVISAADDQIRRTLFSFIDGGNFRRSFVVTNYNQQEVWFCVPETGEIFPSVAAVYNRKLNRWGLRDLPERPAFIAPGQVRLVPEGLSWDSDPDSWDSDPSPWNEGDVGRVDFYELVSVSELAGAGAGQFTFQDGSPDDNGVPVTAELYREGLALGNWSKIKDVKTIWIEATGTPGTVLQVQCGAHDQPDGPAVWGPEHDFVIGTDTRVDVGADDEGISGRYIGVRITCGSELQIVEPWKLNRVVFEHEKRGQF